MLITVSCLTAFPESEDFRVVFDENEVSSSLVHPGEYFFSFLFSSLSLLKIHS